MIDIFILGGVCACAGIFLQFCYSYGNIFSGYFRWITAWLGYGLVRKNGFWRRTSRPPKWKIWAYKILGGCVYCHNVYVSAFLFLLSPCKVFGVFGLIATIVTAHTFLRIFYIFEK